MRSKYYNKKVIYDGISFDSQKECKRYKVLKFREKAGEIMCLELQPKFLLQETFKANGETHRAISYKADFKYFDILENKLIVEDVKGFITDVYKIKKKLFLYKYPGICFIEM